MSDLQDLAVQCLKTSALIPGLVAFSLGSRSTLRTWLAVQQLEEAPKRDEPKRSALWRHLLAFVIVGSVWGAEYYLLTTQSLAVLVTCFTVLFGLIYESSLLNAFTHLFRSYKPAVWRAPKSVLFAHVPGSISWSRVALSVVAATGVNVAAYFGLHYSAGMAVSAALLERFISRTHFGSFSLRVVMISLLTWLALTFALSGAMVMVIANYYMDGAAGDGTVAAKDIDQTTLSLFTPYVANYTPAIMNFGAGLLIAGCYRFDWANHVEANPDIASAHTFEVASPPAKYADRVSAGVVVPKSDPAGFARPYYTTALWTWLLAMLASFGLHASALPIPAEMIATHSVDIVGMTLAILFMVPALFITASIRGEFKRLWTYKEVWVPAQTDEAEGVIALPAGDDEEESLPAYDAGAHRAASLDEKAPITVVEEEVVDTSTKQ